MKSLLLIAALILAVGCAEDKDEFYSDTSGGNNSGGNSNLPPGTPKPLFSPWVEKANGAVRIDLTGSQYRAQRPFTIQILVFSGTCNCEGIPSGDENIGTIEVVTCSGSDARCASARGSAFYERNTANNEIEFCLQTYGCFIFR